ncbi:hypothetical protein ASF06_01825 [Agreia sp. Leaf244]|nr:hypothetical protein ASF06_01825 [Agreia sp. Leaf244]
MGSASYSVPAGSLFVAPQGSDQNSGTQAKPVKTISRAIALATSGKTIVLRAGTYHETLVVPGSKSLTIQNYPKEAVWLDGSSPVSKFVRSGSTWVASGWTTTLDHSPTYSRGAADSTKPGWSFINPAYPLAAYPDQIWVNDKALRQVSSKAQVGSGTFFVDEKADQLIVGTDPSGASVVASTLVRAMTVQSPNSVVQGIGIRRYAPSIPDMGAVRLDNTAKGASVRDVYITEMATTGLSVAAPNATITSVTSSNNGFLGVHSVYADGTTWSKMLIENNNTEQFNSSPAAGGMKITRARNVSVDASVVRNNIGNGLWFDESVYNASVTNSSITGNAHHGLMFELSQKFVAANNYVADNADAGIKIYSSGGADLVNNTVVRNWMNVYVVQDKRRASNTSEPGHDPRQPLPDPTVPWYVQNVSVLNNVIGEAQAGTGCSLCIQDSTKVRTGGQMNITLRGNLFTRLDAKTPTSLIMWPNGSAGTVNYKTVTDFTASTKQGDPGVDYVGSVDASGFAPAAIIAQALAESSPISAALTAKTGIKAKTTVGATHK